MTAIIHCSAGNIHFFSRTTFSQKKDIQLTKQHLSGYFASLTLSSKKFLLPQTSVRPFHLYRSNCLSNHGSRIQSITAVGTDVTVEEPSFGREDADKPLDAPPGSVETSESAPTDSVATVTATRRNTKPVAKSEMPSVKNEDLIPGALFTGKVVAVQSFGAFVDFGAFADGLVHVSRMSDGFVKDAGDLVSVGQEVKVWIVKADMETKKISLTMRGSDDSKRQQGTESPARKNAARSDQKPKTSKFVLGQVLNGTVKNLTKGGAFVSLPDGEEGFIPLSEESKGLRVIGSPSSLTVGQEVKVRVMRFGKGGVTLTMKTSASAVQQLIELNEWDVATSPFASVLRSTDGKE